MKREQEIQIETASQAKKTLKFEIILQFRFFRLKEDGKLYFTIFRSDSEERDLSKPFIHNLLKNIEQYITPYQPELPIEAEFSADGFESDSEFDEEQALLELERMKLETAERERLEELVALEEKAKKQVKREAKTVEEN